MTSLGRWPFVSALIVLVLAACAQPVSTPTPKEVIDMARARMAGLSTVHISVKVPPYDGGPGYELELDVRFPYEVRGVMKGSGEPEEVGLLLTKGRVFTGDPKGVCWSESSHAIGAVFLSTTAVHPILMARLDVAEALRNLEQVPDETAEAEGFYHLSFDIDAPSWYLNVLIPALTQAIGEQFVKKMYPPETREQAFSAPTGWVLKGEAWIDKETLLVHRFLWKQVSTKTGEPGFTSTGTVSRFDQAVPEVPEVEAIRAVGPEPVREDTAPTESVVQEPAREYTSPKTSISLEDKLYRQSKIAFHSKRDGNQEIYVMNPDGSEQKRLTNNPASDVFPSWSPDGKKIAFYSLRDGNWEIYVMNSDGSEQKNLTNNRANDHGSPFPKKFAGPSWSPDGKKIAFTSVGRDRKSGFFGEIYVMNSDGTEQKNLTNNPATDGRPSWSPDGKKIAFTSRRDRNRGIYVMNSDGSEQKRLTNTSAFLWDKPPSWSPDGKKIAFTLNRDGNGEIYVMNSDGTGFKNLTNNPTPDLRPSWSPDGKKIAFISNRDWRLGIYVMNPDGTGLKRLTNTSASDNPPSWSPDGRKIVFKSGGLFEAGIYVMNVDGTERKRLTNNPAPAIDRFPSWSPYLEEKKK